MQKRFFRSMFVWYLITILINHIHPFPIVSYHPVVFRNYYHINLHSLGHQLLYINHNNQSILNLLSSKFPKSRYFPLINFISFFISYFPFHFSLFSFSFSFPYSFRTHLITFSCPLFLFLFFSPVGVYDGPKPVRRSSERAASRDNEKIERRSSVSHRVRQPSLRWRKRK